MTPGVLDFLDRLIREQLAPELYGFVQRLKLKAGSWCPTVGAGSKHIYTTSAIIAYLDEKLISPEDAQDENTINRPPRPLLPPHPAEYTHSLTPINDFVKTLCEVSC